jgi:hypothetical protein
MVNAKALIAVLVITIVIMTLIMIRCMCWKWCKTNFCPDGCCVDDPITVHLPPPYVENPVIQPSAPPAFNPRYEEGEGEQSVTV